MFRNAHNSMLRPLSICLLCLGVVVSLPLNGAGGDDLIARLKPTGKITDLADLLSKGKEDQLRQILDHLDRETTVEIAVVTLPSMEGGQIDDFTNRLFEKWGVGKAGENNGAMLLVAVQERKMRIEVGYGLEAVIPDGLAGSIRDQYILPHFKRNQMEAGIEAGTLALANVLAEHYGVALSAKPTRPSRSEPGDNSPIVFVFFALIVGFMIWSAFHNRDDDDYMGGGRYGTRRYRRRYYGGGFYGGSSRGGFGGGGGFSGGFGGGFSGGGGASGGW